MKKIIKNATITLIGYLNYSYELNAIIKNIADKLYENIKQEIRNNGLNINDFKYIQIKLIISDELINDNN